MRLELRILVQINETASLDTSESVKNGCYSFQFLRSTHHPFCESANVDVSDARDGDGRDRCTPRHHAQSGGADGNSRGSGSTPWGTAPC